MTKKPSSKNHKTYCNKTTLLLMVAGFLCTAHSLMGRVSAAGSLTIAPAFARISISQTEPVQDIAIALKNDYQSTIVVAAAFSAVDISNGALVPADTGDTSIISALSVSRPEFTLEPGQSVNVGVRVTNVDSLAPGGHYAALLFKQRTEASQQVPLEPAISVALFVVKEDGAVRDVAAKLSPLRTITTGLPKTVDVTFSTSGNVDVVPHASVSIVRTVSTNIFSQGVVNESSVPLYPGKELTLRTELTPVNSPRWPGKYAALLRYRYEGQPTAQESAVWFWYIPFWFIGSLLASLLGLGLLAWLSIKKRWIRAAALFLRLHIPMKPASKPHAAKIQPKVRQPTDLQAKQMKVGRDPAVHSTKKLVDNSMVRSVGNKLTKSDSLQKKSNKNALKRSPPTSRAGILSSEKLDNKNKKSISLKPDSELIVDSTAALNQDNKKGISQEPLFSAPVVPKRDKGPKKEQN